MNHEPTADVRARLAMAAALPEYPSAEGLTVREVRRQSRGNERLSFWRLFTKTCDARALPALAALALSRASSDIGIV